MRSARRGRRRAKPCSVTKALCSMSHGTKCAFSTHSRVVRRTHRREQEGNKVIAVGADNAARLLDLQANPNQAQQVAQHDAPIRNVRYVDTPQGGVIITGSWDKTVKVSDGVTPLHGRR